MFFFCIVFMLIVDTMNEWSKWLSGKCSTKLDLFCVNWCDSLIWIRLNEILDMAMKMMIEIGYMPIDRKNIADEKWINFFPTKYFFRYFTRLDTYLKLPVQTYFNFNNENQRNAFCSNALLARNFAIILNRMNDSHSYNLSEGFYNEIIFSIFYLTSVAIQKSMVS